MRLEVVRRRIHELLDGPSCMHGYRAMWHTSRLEAMCIPRNLGERLLRELDPEGCNLRRARRLTRRKYVSMGPNNCWHIDGYDKLKPIHGCIDGWSRKIIRLKVYITFGIIIQMSLPILLKCNCGSKWLS